VRHGRIEHDDGMTCPIRGFDLLPLPVVEPAQRLAFDENR